MDKSLGGAGSASAQMSFCSRTCQRADKSSSIDISGVIWTSWDLRPGPNSIAALNMPSTKKHARSPEVDRLASTRQSMPVQFHQNAPPKRHCQGLKDDHIKALRKLECKHCSEVFQDTAFQSIIACAPHLNAHVHHTAPAPVKSPLQRSPGLAVPHSPSSLPVEGDEGRLKSHGSPVLPHVPLGSSLHMLSSVRDNHAHSRQTHCLDDHTPAWN